MKMWCLAGTLLLFLASCLTTNAQSPFAFMSHSIQPPFLSASFGEETTLVCIIAYPPDADADAILNASPAVSWETELTGTDLSNQRETFDLDDAVTITQRLTISSLTSNYCGEFTCVGRDDTQTSRENVTVDVVPVIVSDPVSQVVTRGEEVTFSCEVASEEDSLLDVTWDGPLDSLPPPTTTYQQDSATFISVLSFNATGFEFEGNYTCTAMYANCIFNVTSMEASLSIEPVPPVVDPDRILSSVSMSATFTCIVDDLSDVVSFQWESATMDTGVFVVIPRQSGQTLTFFVSFSSFGLYRCRTTTTTFGELVSSPAELIVSPEGSLFIIPPGQTNSEIGETEELNCLNQGGPGNTVTWTSSIVGFIGNTRAITVNVSSAFAGGTYTCTVENDAGSDSATTVINVAPEFIEQPESVTVMSINANIELRCVGTGFPIPVIRWIRNESTVETEIDPDASEAITIDVTSSIVDLTHTSILTIASPSNNDSGEYFCVLSTPAVPDFSDVMSDVALVMIQFVELSFAEEQYIVDEGTSNGVLEVCVVLGGVPTGTEFEVTLTFISKENTASEDMDYGGVNTTSFFAIGSVNGDQQCINITIINDEAFEKEEGFSLLVLSESTDDSQVFITIADEDVVNVNFTMEEHFVGEEDETAEVCVELVTGEEPTQELVWVSYETSDGTAIGGADYAAVSGNLSFPENSRNGAIVCENITIMNDEVFEEEENFTVVLESTEKNVRVGEPTTVVIEDNEVVNLNVSVNESVGEGDGEILVEVFVDSLPAGGSDNPIQVFISTTEGSASDPEDFQGLDSFTVTISSNALEGSSKTVSIVIQDDLIFERNENFTLLVSSEPNVNIDAMEHTVFILDNEVVEVTFADEQYTVDEDTPTGLLEVCVVLGGVNSTEAEVMLNFVSEEDTSLENLDYEAVDVLSLFPEGSERDDQQCINITVINDEAFEGEESFTVVASSSTYRVTFNNPVIITIIDEDVVLVNFTMEEHFVGEEAGLVEFCVQLLTSSEPTQEIVLVTYETSDGTAIGGSDYVTESGGFSFPTNSSSGDGVCEVIVILNDDAFEMNENFEITFNSSVERVRVGEPATVIIEEVAMVGLSKSVYSGQEGETVEICVEITLFSGPPLNTQGQVLIEISTPLDLDVFSVNQSIAGSQVSIRIPGNAIDGDEYCEGTVIPVDSIFNTDDFLMLELTLPSDSIFEVDPTRNTGGLQLIDDEVAYVSFAESSPVIVEEALGTATVCFVLTGVKDCTERAIVLSVTSQDGSAYSGADFDKVRQIVSINAGSEDGSETCFTFDLIDDAFVEKTEYFTLHVKLEDRNVWIKGSPYLNLTICDDDVAEVGFVQNSYEVEEDAGFVMICMVISNLVNPIMSDLWVDISTVELTDEAIANADFVPLDQETLSFFIGSDNGDMACVNISIEDDDNFEANEQFTVRVDVVEENIVLQAPTMITVTILDDEEVDIEFNAPIYTFMEGTLTAQICGVLGGLDGDIETNIMFSIDSDDMDGSAEGGDVDYTDITFSSMFVPGNGNGAMQCTAVNIIDDNKFEKPENFSIHLTGQDRVNTANPYAEVVIISDDEVTLAVSVPVSVDESAGPLVVTVSVAAIPVDGICDPIWVFVSTASDTATAPEDFQALNSFILTIPAGATVGTSDSFNIEIEDDLIFEKNQQFTVMLSSEDNVNIDETPFEVTIVDDEQVELTFVEEAYSVDEDTPTGVIEVCVELGGVVGPPTEAEVWLDFSTVQDTANDNMDFVPLNMFASPFPVGSSNGSQECINITIMNDEAFEKDETFSVLIASNDDGVTVDDPVTVTIESDDVVYVHFIMDEYTVSEVAGTVRVCVQLLTGEEPTQSSVWVSYETSPDSATDGPDFVGKNGIFQFPEGSVDGASMCEDIAIQDDLFFEKEENFTVVLESTEENVRVGEPTTVIIEDDEVVFVKFSDPPFSDVTEDQSPFQVCVELCDLAGPTQVPIWLQFSSADGDAMVDSDFEPITDMQSFPSGSKVGEPVCITVSLLNDGAFEKPEYFTVLVSSEPEVEVLNNHTVHIEDDDMVDLEFIETSLTLAEESDVIMVCVRLANLAEPTQAPIWLIFSSEDGTAIAGQDYMEVDDSSMYFPPNSNTGDDECTEVRILDDNAFEKEEYFTVLVASEDNVNVLNNLTITITDNEEVYVAFVGSQLNVMESDGFVEVCVELSNVIDPTGAEIGLTFTSTDGSAMAGQDFEKVDDSSAYFPPGSNNGDHVCINVTLTDNRAFEKDETFTLHVTSEPGVLIHSDNTIFIQDDDIVYVSFSQEEYTFLEGDGEMEICLVLSEVAEDTLDDLWVSVSSQDGSATSEGASPDFTAIMETLSFEAGSADGATVCAPFEILEDTMAEMSEEFSVHISLEEGVSSARVHNRYALVHILDNDQPMFGFTEGTYSVEEGDTDAVVTVELLSIPGSASTLTESVAITIETVTGGTATASEDFTGVSGVVVFPTGSEVGTSRDFIVPINTDSTLEDDETISVCGTIPVGEGIFPFGLNKGFTVIAIEDDDLTFAGDTPTVDGTSFFVQYNINADVPIVTAECRIANEDAVDCSGGLATLTFSGRSRTDIVVTVVFASGATQTITRQVRRDRVVCDQHLINEGVTFNEDTVTIQFEGTGPLPDSELFYRCTLQELPSIDSDTAIAGSSISSSCFRTYTTPQLVSGMPYRVNIVGEVINRDELGCSRLILRRVIFTGP